MTHEYAGYLAHHGVKGQRWGVRRKQDENVPSNKQTKNGDASKPSYLQKVLGVGAALAIMYGASKVGQTKTAQAIKKYARVKIADIKYARAKRQEQNLFKLGLKG